jgi:hypothetical protein
MRNVSRRALLYGVPVVAGAALITTGPGADIAGKTSMRLADATLTGGVVASPKDFGAVGDGASDDTLAVNACLAQSRAIDFGGPETTYLITGTLLVQQAVPQTLTGRGATVKAGAAVHMMRLQNASHAVSGIVFDGNGQASGLGLVVEGTAPGSRVEECRFVNVAGCGIQIQVGAHRCRISGCVIDNCGHGSGTVPPFNTSIFVADADYCSVLDNEVLQCDWGISFRGADPRPGINLYHCRGNTVTCMSPAPAASQGISNAHGYNGRIEGNTIIGFDDNSIDCHGCSDLTIVGNTIIGGKDGVFVGDDPSANVTITGNVFTRPQRAVRVLSGTTGALIIGVVIAANTVSYPTDGGILVSQQGSAEVSGIDVVDNSVHVAGFGTYGVKVVGAGQCRIAGNRIYRPTQEAIYLDTVDIVEVSDNLLQDASYLAPNTHNAINVTSSDPTLPSHRVTMRNNTAYGGARFAVNIDGGSGMTVTGTRWRSLGTGGMGNRPTDTVESDNMQY